MTSQHQEPLAVRPRAGEIALTLLRLIAGIILMAHGWSKLTDVSGWQQQVASLGIPLPEISGWLAIAAEFLGGFGLAIGFLTPLATAGIAFTMAMAIVTVHWGNGLLAQNNGYELPLLLLTVALTFMARGAGEYSADELLKRARDTSRSKQQQREGGSQPVGHQEPRWSER